MQSVFMYNNMICFEVHVLTLYRLFLCACYIEFVSLVQNAHL